MAYAEAVTIFGILERYPNREEAETCLRQHERALIRMGLRKPPHRRR